MPGKIETRLAELGLTLPEVSKPAANYVTYLRDGDHLWISGQVPGRPEGLMIGKLGDDYTVDQGVEAAQLCGLHLIAQMKDACSGDLDQVAQVIKLVGFVNSTPDFGDQPKVINGASDLMVDVFGDVGRHARSAVSAVSLPFGVAVEIEAVVRLK